MDRLAKAQLGVTLLPDAAGAEVILKFRRQLVAETKGGQFGANGGMPMDAGRGEVSVVNDGTLRVVLLFEDLKTSRLEKTRR